MLRRYGERIACSLGATFAVTWRLFSQSDLGVIWIRPDVMKRRLRVVVDQLATLKADQKLNAEDNTSDLLAEAEYILNNADEFLAGIEEDEYALAA